MNREALPQAVMTEPSVAGAASFAGVQAGVFDFLVGAPARAIFHVRET